MKKVNLGKFKIDVSNNENPILISRILWCYGMDLFINYKGDELRVKKVQGHYKAIY